VQRLALDEVDRRSRDQERVKVTEKLDEVREQVSRHADAALLVLNRPVKNVGLPLSREEKAHVRWLRVPPLESRRPVRGKDGDEYEHALTRLLDKLLLAAVYCTKGQNPRKKDATRSSSKPNCIVRRGS
jgi:hypothetical protein